MTTEVVCFPLRGPRTIQVEEALKKTLNLLTVQEGFERAYWGWQEEDSNICWVLVDWTSIEAHLNLQKQDYYKPFVDELDRVANVFQLQAFHAHLSPHPATKALSNRTSPATEICTIHFPATYAARDKKKFEQDLFNLVRIIESNVPTSTGFAGGWAVEKLSLPGTSEETTTFIACMGWQSVEAHFAFRETPLFKEHKHLLDQAKDLMHVQMVHVSATQVGYGGHF
ncbi:hypothetical protein LTR10_013341 [Elasticomyces elasticus]|uniref:ABM domain-containing protein n=1 Tax=Exophiala sideris TaxID=1016849 RepID=A0ABR0J4N9_9EURO|nr:hypothetical protein LTR10_013341 [Elasticomyces elasticus]KAK5027430.1 hypothetical protein LTS07_007032 [Exophiala sideris]KAK5034868.1 hypothetical protein LTR13_006050 [Exophiala sideris]KAK5056398.1 hypothetical protein LTR69_007939 [Exophiala sideris]KAK5181113.1 hypothetical protein LTR44_006444 [Eurotiomycetes sp. CCFEE 6388]